MTSASPAKLAAAGLAVGIVYSELGFISEQSSRPVKPGSDILPHEIFPGPEPDSPVIFFLHGWPDDLTMLRKYAKALSARYHCVNCTLPGYPVPAEFEGHTGTVPQRKWGFGFAEAARAVMATIGISFIV
jgi:pimeloyl-ACP methyl ester carboxylesterase